MRTTELEIERKFLILSDSPELATILAKSDYYLIRQGYFPTDSIEYSDRVRLIYGCGFEKAERTRKTGLSALERNEETEPLDFKEGIILYESAPWKIEKTRFNFGRFELDVFQGPLAGLKILEIELEHTDEEIELPPGLELREVTDDPRYLNMNLAQLGSLEELGMYVADKFTFVLDAGIAYCQERIVDLIKKNDGLVILPVAGPSASGKTSRVSAVLASGFGNKAAILKMDDYFIGRERMVELGLGDNFDSPYAVDMQLFAEHLKELALGNTIQKPTYSFETGQRVGTESFVPPPLLLIVDGIFALHPMLAELYDFSVFVDVSTHGALWRRLLRDTERTGQSGEDIFVQFAQMVHPASGLYVDPQKDFADVIIENEMVPHEEMRFEDEREVAVKVLLSENPEDGRPEFSFSEAFEMFTELGCKPTERDSVSQIDTYYYFPTTAIMLDTEIVRVRVERSDDSSSLTLTYKGPRDDRDFSRGKRSIKFHRDMNAQEVRGLLVGMGYRAMDTTPHGTTVEKLRYFYSYPPDSTITLAFDMVFFPFHRNFIEIQGESYEGVMRVVKRFKELGVPAELLTRASYLELYLLSQ